MKNIYLYAAHTSFSPGGVLWDRNEHSDVMKFVKYLGSVLSCNENLHVKVLTGNIKPLPDAHAVFIFHRDWNDTHNRKHGCAVYTVRDSNVRIQYDAYRLLESITGEGAFRYNGVHSHHVREGFSSLNNTLCENTFLFTLGYMDSFRDNTIFDRNVYILARRFAHKVNEMYEEKKNEDNTGI